MFLMYYFFERKLLIFLNVSVNLIYFSFFVYKSLIIGFEGKYSLRVFWILILKLETYDMFIVVKL